MPNSPAASEGRVPGQVVSGAVATSVQPWPAIERASEILLSIEPVWSLGAFAYVYLTVLNIVDGQPWLGLLAGVLPFLVRWATRGYVSRRTPFDLPIVLLLLAGLVGIFASSDRSLSWGVYQTLLACVLLYYSFVNYSRPRLLVIWVLSFAFVLFLVFGGYVFLQVPTSVPFFSQLQSWIQPDPQSLPSGWTSPLLGANVSGVTVAIEVVAVTLAAVAIFPGRRTVRLTAGLCSLLLLAVLMISLSRATWLVLAVGMIVLLGWRSRWLLLSIPLWAGVVWWSLTARLGYSWAQVSKTLISFGGRTTSKWPYVADAVAEHPIAGCGLGGYSVPYSHNAYLQFYCDFGLLGAVSLIVALVVLVTRASQIRKRPLNHPWMGIVVGTCVAAILALLYGVIESAPACILVLGTDSHYYAVSPLFPLLGVVLVVSHRVLLSGSGNSERDEKESE